MAQVFTHILCVKLLDTQKDELLEDIKLLQAIKDLITYKLQIESIPYNNDHDIDVLIEWDQVNWNKTYSCLIEGDIITNTYYGDEQIELHTLRMLSGIELFIKTHYTEINNNNWKIIYHVSKPIDKNLTNKLLQKPN